MVGLQVVVVTLLTTSGVMDVHAGPDDNRWFRDRIITKSNSAEGRATKAYRDPTPEELISAGDLNGDLMLDPEEYKSVRYGEGITDTQTFFATADKNGDGLISVVELRAEAAAEAALVSYDNPLRERRLRKLAYYENNWLVFGFLGLDVVVIIGFIRWLRRKPRAAAQAVDAPRDVATE